MTFAQKLDTAIVKNNSLLCISLDPDPEKLAGRSLFEFNKTIIAQTHDLVCAYKPNSAFYEAEGSNGVIQLKKTCEYIQKNYPSIPIILDAKRGDIENSNQGYITYAFDYLGCDALTLHPYMGYQSLSPFFNMTDKGLFVLCKTSNQGSDELQNLMVEGKPLYLYLAEKIAIGWNVSGNIMLVVGATYPIELKKVREVVGDMTLLVPGVGHQGGEAGAVVSAGLNSYKKGLIIAVGRSVLYSENPRVEAERICGEINKFRNI